MNNPEWQKDKVIEMADTRIINYSGKPLCENYRNPLERCETAAQAIRLYKNCISWALRERYPTKDDLLAFASKRTLAESGVYIDMDFDGERIDDHVCCVFLGCSGWIRSGLNLEKAIIPMLYLSEQSNLKVQVDDGLMHPMPVELYHGSKVGGNIKRLAVKDLSNAKSRVNINYDPRLSHVDPEIINNEAL